MEFTLTAAGPDMKEYQCAAVGSKVIIKGQGKDAKVFANACSAVMGGHLKKLLDGAAAGLKAITV